MQKTITIELTDEQVLRLGELAHEAAVSPEELVRASVALMLSPPKEEFTRAAEYVLRKNAEIYRRLS